MVGILRDTNKFIGCKKITVVYPEGCYRHYFFKHDIKYCVVLKKYERFFELLSIILRHWIRVFLWFSLPGTKVDKVPWFLKRFIYFILSSLCCDNAFSDNQKIFTTYAIKLYLWYQIILEISKLIAVYIKKTVIPNISVSFDYFFHDNL